MQNSSFDSAQDVPFDRLGASGWSFDLIDLYRSG